MLCPAFAFTIFALVLSKRLMNPTKILFICQEITPYLPESDFSTLCRKLPQSAQERGCEIRTFMPKYGCVNERRNQLHEVIRLSGMNLIINDNDHPLIIKVASIQSARMQIYFIDNDDFFHRKQLFTDDEGKEFEDNCDRCIFYARGVIETVRKLRWVPDIVHCHGWISALAPLYIKKAFNEDPYFKNAKVVYSIYNDGFKQAFPKSFNQKLLLGNIQADDISEIKTKATFANLGKLAIRYSDGIIQASPKINADLKKAAESSGKPFLIGSDADNYANYNAFYDQILMK